MDFKYLTADERENLYNEVWAEPVTIVAKRYDMSDNGLRKHCIRLGIPLPPSGYWAKVKAGQKVQKAALPKVTGELRKYVRNYAVKYRADVDTLTDTELMSDEELFLLKDETKAFIRERCSQVQVKSQLRNPHHFIDEHKQEIIYRKKRDKALKQASFNSNYYASEKSKYRDNKATLPIYVSDSNTNRAYRILDTIIKTLDDMEGYIRIGQDSGKDIACFVIMRTEFYFEVKEETKKKRPLKDNDEDRTFLTLTMSARSWFRNIIGQNLEYKDNDGGPLEIPIGKMIYNMCIVANKLVAADILKRREEERVWEEQERQRRLERMRKGELEEIKLLEQASSDWDKAERIRRFANSMEEKLVEITDQDKKDKLLKWLQWARDKADWIDPLCDKEDQLLGKSKTIFEVINDMKF